MIPLSTPHITGNEWKYVKDCLDTGWVSSVGKYVQFFEEKLASVIGKSHATACINGTAALHIALMVAGVKAGDEVIVPALTFVAPANAVRYLGAYPVFIDVDPEFWQLDPQKLEDFLVKECELKGKDLVNKNTGRIVKAIIPVDLLGHPVDMDAILKVAHRFNLMVIEDNAESLGAGYKNQPVGLKADLVCLSFNGNKVVTSGGGGMILTDNASWAKRARYLTTQAKVNEVDYIHEDIGFNYRLSNVQAAIGLAQIEQLDVFIAQKRVMAQRYNEGLRNIKGIRLPKEASWAKSSYWLYTILIDNAVYKESNRMVLQRLHGLGIQSRPLWHPLHRLLPFAECYAYQIKEADRLFDCALSLPSSVHLTEEDQARVIDVLAKRE